MDATDWTDGAAASLVVGPPTVCRWKGGSNKAAAGEPWPPVTPLSASRAARTRARVRMARLTGAAGGGTSRLCCLSAAFSPGTGPRYKVLSLNFDMARECFVPNL